MLEDAVELWLQRPFTGWGLDQFRNVSGWNTYSHDNYVELLANQGIVGCLLYLMVYVSTLVSLLRSLGRSRDAGLSADVFWAMVVVVVAMGWDVGAVSYYDRLSWVRAEHGDRGLSAGQEPPALRKARTRRRTVPGSGRSRRGSAGR